MKTAVKILGIACFLGCTQLGLAQKSVKEYADKTKKEKMQKSMVMAGAPVSVTPKAFRDGHGKFPLFTSKDQLPDTIALITFNISDLGLTTSWSNDYAVYTQQFSLNEAGGNAVANEMMKQSLDAMKAKFAEEGGGAFDDWGVP